jgi:uncharacterized Rmd1/YagE family protein
MTNFEHTVIALCFYGIIYIWGFYSGKKRGIIETLSYLEEEGYIKFLKKDDEEK